MSQPTSSSSSSFYVIDYEKQFLSAVIRTEGAVLADTPHITAGDFSETNRVVFNAIQSCLAGGSFNRFILIQKLNGLNIKIGGVIEPEIYINAIADLNGVSDRAAIEISKQIKQVTIRRELDRTIDQMKRLVKESKDMKASELVAETTALFNGKINIFAGSGDDEPQDLFGDIQQYIESIQMDHEDGPKPPFPLYHSLWGTFSPGDMSVYCARPKGAKSTFLMNMVEQCVEHDPNVACLMLDTELETRRVQRRAVSAIANVNEFHLRTGVWRKDPKMVANVTAAWGRIGRLMNKIHHVYVGGKSTEEMLSICRRWHKKHVYGTKKKALICLDYIKLGSVDLETMGAMKDYQSVGKKVDQFKQLATELGCHVLTAAQTNRSNEAKDMANRRSDGAAIGLSDFISQYASNIYILEKLTLEQMAEFNTLDCTHTLSCIYARNLGPEGAAPLVKYVDDKGKDRWTEDFVFYRIRNFRVTELVNFRAASQRMNIRGVNVQPTPPPAALNADGFTVL